MRIIMSVITLVLFAACESATQAQNLALDSRFRITFNTDASTLPEQGELASADADAIARIAKVFERVGELHRLRFLLVSSKANCKDMDLCNRLLWERGNRIMNEVDAILHKQGKSVPFNNLTFIFSEKMRLHGTGSLALPADTLTLLLDHSDVGMDPEPCQANVYLQDADLPNMISREPGVPMSSGEKAVITPNTQFIVSVADKRPVHPMWADLSGRLRRAGGVHPGTFTSPAPPGAGRLYVVTSQQDNTEVNRFMGQLNDTFTPYPMPTFLDNAIKTASADNGSPADDRGVGDNLLPLVPGPETAATMANVKVCRYDFSTAR